MAVQLTTGDSLELGYNATTRISYLGPFCVAGWVRAATTIDAFDVQTLFIIHDNFAAPNYVQFCLTGNNDGNASLGSIITDDVSDDPGSVTVALGADVYWICTCDGAATPTYSLYIGGTLSAQVTLARAETGIATYEWGAFTPGFDELNGNDNAGLAAGKMWAAEKTAATIDTDESPYRNAQDTADLIDEWHLDDAATAATSETGNNDLTINGTLADEADPPGILGDDPAAGEPSILVVMPRQVIAERF